MLIIIFIIEQRLTRTGRTIPNYNESSSDSDGDPISEVVNYKAKIYNLSDVHNEINSSPINEVRYMSNFLCFYSISYRLLLFFFSGR